MRKNWVVATIPVEDQKLILETNIEELMDHFLSFSSTDGQEIKLELVSRLRGGQAKYGTAWCEVDLKTDLIEEILDAFNYFFMSMEREGDRSFPAIAFYYLAQLYAIAKDMPDFAGPTSKDWILQQGLDPKEQQRKFQQQLPAGHGSSGTCERCGHEEQ